MPVGTETSELWEQLDQQNFAEDYRSMLQNTAEDVETMSLEQADEHLDVKQLQLVHKQLRLAESLQDEAGIFSSDVSWVSSWRESILSYSREPEL